MAVRRGLMYQPLDTLPLVARAKITSSWRNGCYAAAGTGLLEVSRRGVRARIVRPVVEHPVHGVQPSSVAVSIDDELLISGGIRPGWHVASEIRGAKRGIIREFSASARRRFVYRLSNWRGADQLVTLTTRLNEQNAARSSRALGRWLNWARSRGLRGYVWVRERQRRGALHYHVWTDGFATVKATEARDAWLRAVGELGDKHSRQHAVKLTSWQGPAWYAVAEGAKRIQKRTGKLRPDESAGRFWSCSRDVSRESVTIPVGVDGLRWFRRWLKKIAPEYHRSVRAVVERARVAAKDSPAIAAQLAAMVARNGAAWLGRAPRRLFPRGRKRKRRKWESGFLMLDRLPEIEDRLMAAVGALVKYDKGRGLHVRLSRDLTRYRTLCVHP